MVDFAPIVAPMLPPIATTQEPTDTSHCFYTKTVSVQHFAVFVQKLLSLMAP